MSLDFSITRVILITTTKNSPTSGDICRPSSIGSTDNNRTSGPEHSVPGRPLQLVHWDAWLVVLGSFNLNYCYFITVHVDYSHVLDYCIIKI